MPTVSVGRSRISYWIGREDLSEKREVVVFIHGAGGGQYTWGYQKAFFKGRFNPIILELPGHGASEGEGEAEIGKYAEHVHAFLNALGLSKVFLVGHSMGGAITQTVALKHPEVLKGIVLVGTGAKLRVLPLILNGIRTNFEETVRKITELAYSRKTPREMIDRGVADMMQCRPEILYGDFLACDRFDLMSEVEKIELPALIISGNEDELTPVKYAQFLHSRLKRSKLEVLPGAGHMVMMEAAEPFNEKIGAFLSNPIASGSS
ncbi:MAG: alpha/beta fold hydrolase [Thermodesulfobacteriota bacterium]